MIVQSKPEIRLPPPSLFPTLSWVGFSCPRNVYDIILQLRDELDKTLRWKIENPKEEFSSGAKGLIEAVNTILHEGKESDTVYVRARAQTRPNY